MKLPGYERAVVPERKVTAYLLSLSHRDGRSKAAFFLRFGFTADRWEVFAEALRQHAQAHDVAEIEQTPFGVSYAIDGSLEAPDGRRPRIRVVWFISSESDAPHLVTAYPAKEARDD